MPIINRFLLALIYVICVAQSYGQKDSSKISVGKIAVEVTKEKRPKKIYAKVEIKSPFRGGDSVWVESLETGLNKSIQVHLRNRYMKAGKYTVIVSFILDKTGLPAEIFSENDPGFGVKEEVIRTFRKGNGWKFTNEASEHHYLSPFFLCSSSSATTKIYHYLFTFGLWK